MHPILMAEWARQHGADLEAAATKRCLARSAPRARGGAWVRRHVRAAVGRHLVATGWALLEAGLPRTQTAPRTCECDEAPF